MEQYLNQLSASEYDQIHVRFKRTKHSLCSLYVKYNMQGSSTAVICHKAGAPLELGYLIHYAVYFELVHLNESNL